MLFPWYYFLKEDEQLLVESFTRRRVFNGPGKFLVPPFTRTRRRKAITLGPTDYLHVRNTLTGQVSLQAGPKLFFPEAYEELQAKLSAIPLKNNQYVRLLDRSTGNIRVERGEGVVYLLPSEEVIENVREGVNIDDQNAVLVRNLERGTLELVTTPQVFIPSPQQEIVEVRKRILLEDHDTVVIKDDTGKYIFRKGSERDRAFFLQPYWELDTFYWSSGLFKDKKGLKITHIDSRPKFMWYDFAVRTQDNVELVIGITFFWQIVDVETMVRHTDDPTGDVCAHARSAIIQAVSQVTLETFLSTFNSLVHAVVVEVNDSFYTERGIVLRAVEVRAISCKDPSTQEILQEVIQEATNRLNRLQKQESENEVRLRQLQGEIVAEELRGQLLEKQREHLRAEGQMEGEAEAGRVRAFLENLGGEVTLEDRIGLFETLRKSETLQKLSEGKAQLYFTPAEVDLSIESRN